MPGALIPGDLERIQEFVGDTSTEFVLNNFQVSDGAKVLKRVKGTDYLISVPSIVPAQKPDGSCVFLDENDRCKIHSVSPFGCAYCDSHQSKEEGEARVRFMVTAQIEAHQHNAPFSQMCVLLEQLGLRAKPLEQRREAMTQAFEAIDGQTTDLV